MWGERRYGWISRYELLYVLYALIHTMSHTCHNNKNHLMEKLRYFHKRSDG